MKYTLPYGESDLLTFDVPQATEVIDYTSARGTPLEDPASAMTNALREPLHYPPLAAATVPGDKITLVIEPGLPAVEALAAGALYEILERGTDPRDVTVVTGSNLRAVLTLVPERMRQDLHVILHNPSDQESLQYLAADKEARPIYLNRALCDADFVLPIMSSRLPTALDFVGGYSGLYPIFADLETQQRFRAGSNADHAAHQRRRHDEADEAAWQLGLHFIAQVVPGRGDEVLGIVAGEAQSVIAEAQRQHAAAWQHPLPTKAGVVIAAIDGGEEQQTWEHLARALDVAQQSVSDGGAIVLVSSLALRIGPALARLAGNERDRELLRHLAKDNTPDAHAAMLLADARERYDLFLWSELVPEQVEEMGLAPLSDVDELQRLVQRYPSLLLLGSAQHAGVSLDVESLQSESQSRQA